MFYLLSVMRTSHPILLVLLAAQLLLQEIRMLVAQVSYVTQAVTFFTA